MTQQLIRSRLAILGFATATALVAASCAVTYTDAHYGPEEVNRQVVDAATGRGIGDAIVVFERDRREVDIGHGARTFCVQVQMVRTDAGGRYTVPTWEGRMGMIMSVYKRGYARVNDPVAMNKGIDKLKPGSEDFSQRVVELARSLIGCSDEQEKKLVDLYRALLNDAMSVAKTDEDRRRAERHFLGPLETAQFGIDEASRRAAERARNQ